MTTLLDVLVAMAEAVDAAVRHGDVWGPVLLSAGLAVVGWRLRPRDGQHRTPLAWWTYVRTVAGAVRARASARVRLRADDVQATPVTCADGRPAPSADDRPPEGGRADGGD